MNFKSKEVKTALIYIGFGHCFCIQCAYAQYRKKIFWFNTINQ